MQDENGALQIADDVRNYSQYLFIIQFLELDLTGLASRAQKLATAAQIGLGCLMDQPAIDPVKSAWIGQVPAELGSFYLWYGQFLLKPLSDDQQLNQLPTVEPVTDWHCFDWINNQVG